MLTSLLVIAALSLTPDETGIKWFNGSFEEAKAAAESEGKLLLTYFWANTPQCELLYSQTMADEGVIGRMNGMVCYSANVTEAAPREVFDFYGLDTIPAMMVTDTSGTDLEIMTGFMNPATFQNEFTRIANGINTIPDLLEKVKAKYKTLEEELVIRKMLADKLGLMGKQLESNKMLEDIKNMDLKNNTYTVALMSFNEVLAEVTNASQVPSEWNINKLEVFIKQLPRGNKRARFDCITQIANLHVTRGDQKEAITTFQDAWKQQPGDYNAIGSASTIVNQILALPDPVGPKDLKFARSVAYGIIDIVEEDHAKYCEVDQCNGSNRNCEGYAKDNAAAAAGNASGNFVTGRNTTPRAFLDYLVVRTEHSLGREEQAIDLLKILIEENPGNSNFVATLNNYEHPEDSLDVAGGSD